MSKFPNPCCQNLEKIVDNNPEISKMDLKQFQVFRYIFISWLTLYQKQIQECKFCWPFFCDVIYPNLAHLRKICLLCAYKKIDSLAGQVNSRLTIKDEQGVVQDKEKLSQELMGELLSHWLRKEKSIKD